MPFVQGNVSTNEQLSQPPFERATGTKSNWCSPENLFTNQKIINSPIATRKRYSGARISIAITCLLRYYSLLILGQWGCWYISQLISIRGKVHITKMSGGLIRSKLFICRFSAKNTIVACAALFDRLVAKGENKKLALIAVCNKLLKQAFAIVESGVLYQADFSLRLAPIP